MQNNEKSLARLAAIQTNYSRNIDKEQDVDNILDLTVEEIKQERGSLKKSFAKKLIGLAIENEESLNSTINQNSQKTENKNVNVLVNSILQVALSELMVDEKLDRKIIVSEYVNLTSDFFGDKETGYVNAVLDKFIKS